MRGRLGNHRCWGDYRVSVLVQWLPGQRLHLQQGPIDLVIQAEGEPDVVRQAHAIAQRRFGEVLPSLVQEIKLLRTPVQTERNPMQGEVARLMWQACAPFAYGTFLTPMAAVAGAVAQHMLEPYQCSGIDRAWVNNGGDIALRLTGSQVLRLGLFSEIDRVMSNLSLGQQVELDGMATLDARSGVGGVATSGWRGRSHSLGIADSVTVFAANAMTADVAATLVANAVNIHDESIVRRRASDLSDDSDLGDYLVTVDVPKLAREKVSVALNRGLEKAQAYRDAGLLQSAVLICQGQVVSVNGHQTLSKPTFVQEQALCLQS